MGKKFEAAKKQVPEHPLTIEDAIPLLQKVKFAKFDETVELTARLGVDPKHADQMVRGTVVLPHGLGKSKKVLVIAGGDKQKEAQDAGADHIAGEEVVDKINGGWMDFDAVVATPDMMRAVGRLGKVLGPRGLMPNPKTGTVTFEIANAVKEIKAGKVEFRVDKTGIIHAPVGKISFAAESLIANTHALRRQHREGQAGGGEGQISQERHAVIDDGSWHPHRHGASPTCGETLMAVTRAAKQEELTQLESDLKGTDSAILVDYKGLNVPQVTDLRRELRKAKATYKVVKNTIARRAIKGTAFEALTEHFVGTTAIAYTDEGSGRARQDADDVREDRAVAADQGGGRAGARHQGGRGHRPRLAAGQARAVREAAVPAAARRWCSWSAC